MPYRDSLWTGFVGLRVAAGKGPGVVYQSQSLCTPKSATESLRRNANE